MNLQRFETIDTSKITIEDALKEIERELNLRHIVYPRQIRRGQMTRNDANKHFTLLLAAHRILLDKNQKRTAKQIPLF